MCANHDHIHRKHEAFSEKVQCAISLGCTLTLRLVSLLLKQKCTNTYTSKQFHAGKGPYVSQVKALCISIYPGCRKAGKQQAKILDGLLNAEKYIHIQVYKRIRGVCWGHGDIPFGLLLLKDHLKVFFQTGIEGRNDPETL